MNFNYFRIYKWGISIRIMSANRLYFNFCLAYGKFINRMASGFTFAIHGYQKLPEGLEPFKGICLQKVIGESNIEKAVK